MIPVRVHIRKSTKVGTIGKEPGRLISKCIKAAVSSDNIRHPCAVDVTIVTDREIRELNRSFRDRDSETDVLSFPMYDFTNGKPNEKIDGEISPDTGRLMLGDVVISYERACAQAKEYGHSVERECGYLAVHSALHLLGYDHERSEKDKRVMRKKEEEILKGLSLLRE